MTPSKKPAISAELLETLLGPPPAPAPVSVQVHVAPGAQIFLFAGGAPQGPLPAAPVATAKEAG
ncbi:MAG: hypothetical protein IRY92_05725 [Dactylosporangium sp.]|nr:hypothetical protein [Dactylosporangium sp.]